MCTAVLFYCYIQHSELCVQLYWFTVIYSTGNCVYSCIGVMLYTAQAIGNCVYSCNGVLLYTAQGIVCTAVLFYCYIQHRELCVKLYRFTVICSTGNSVYSCIVYCCIQHKELCIKLYCHTIIYSMDNTEICVQLYCLTVIYSTGNCVYRRTGVLLYTAQPIWNNVYSCTVVQLYRA